MASGVNVKMGVSGVQQFKQGMQQARQSVKTLDAELQLNEKQFKASGDAEEYMQKKADLLQKKIQEQQKAVDNATKALEEMEKNGVDKASTAYQKMAQQLVQAKGDLLDTETALGNIGTAAEEAESGVSGMQQQLQSINKGISYDNITSALHTITGGMETVMRTAINLGKTITREVLGAGSWADDLVTRATYYGMSQEDLQRMEKTADLIDTPVDAIINARRKMDNAFGNGKKATVNALHELGLDNIVSQEAEDAFWEIGEALMNMGSEYDKEAAAQKLFGRSWVELIPLFEAGREEYEKLNASWNVVPEEQIKALTEMDDKYQTLQNELDTVKNTFLGELAPAVTTVLGTLADLVGKFNDYPQTDKGKEMMESLSNAVTSLFDDLKNVDPDKVMETVQGVLDKITDALKWIDENHETVLNFAEGFVKAWMGLKLTSGIVGVMQLIAGIKGLGGGGLGGVHSPFLTGTGTGTGTGTADTGTGGTGLGADALFGIGGAIAIYEGFKMAADRRKNHSELVRGTDENLAARTAGVDDLLVEYINAQKAMEDALTNFDISPEEAEAIVTKAEEINQKLRETEGGIEALQAYSDWRQEHSYGNMDWVMPDWLSGAADKTDAALSKMTEVADSSAKTAENAPTKQDLSLFQKVPANIGAAIEKSLAGMGIVMDGQIVAQIVSQYQGTGVVGYVNP